MLLFFFLIIKISKIQLISTYVKEKTMFINNDLEQRLPNFSRFDPFYKLLILVSHTSINCNLIFYIL